MRLVWTRYESIGSVALLACAGAVLLLGVQPLVEARQDAERRRLEMRTGEAEIETLRQRSELFEARVARAEQARPTRDASLGELSRRNDETAWILGVADRLGVRVDRIQPGPVVGAEGARRAPLRLEGAADAPSVARFLSEIRAQRPALVLRRLEMDARPARAGDGEAGAGMLAVSIELDWRLAPEPATQHADARTETMP